VHESKTNSYRCPGIPLNRDDCYSAIDYQLLDGSLSLTKETGCLSIANEGELSLEEK